MKDTPIAINLMRFCPTNHLQLRFIITVVVLILTKRALSQGWGTCGPREHSIWPASEFSLPRYITQRRVKTILTQLVRKSISCSS